MRVKVYLDLWPGPDTGWACATECDGEYEDGGALDAEDEGEAIAAAQSRFPSAEEIIVGDSHADDAPAQSW